MYEIDQTRITDDIKYKLNKPLFDIRLAQRIAEMARQLSNLADLEDAMTIIANELNLISEIIDNIPTERPETRQVKSLGQLIDYYGDDNDNKKYYQY